VKAGITILNMLFKTNHFVLDFFSLQPRLDLNKDNAVTIISRKRLLAAFENTTHLAENVVNMLSSVCECVD